MLIPIRGVIHDSFIECYESACPHKNECANHYTAGDFRAEDGLTPDIEQLPSGMVVCSQEPESHGGMRLTDGTTYYDKWG